MAKKNRPAPGALLPGMRDEFWDFAVEMAGGPFLIVRTVEVHGRTRRDVQRRMSAGDDGSNLASVTPIRGRIGS